MEEAMRRRFLAMALLFLGLAGCWGDGLRRVSVQGKLTAKGQPLDGATVQFIPLGSTKGEGGMGRSESDGSFTLIGSRAGAKGVVPGEYKVRVSRLIARDGTPLPADATEADNPGSRESVPGPYNSLEATPLKATVPATGGTVTIDIPANVVRRK
jgi:hypothetical protein